MRVRHHRLVRRRQRDAPRARLQLHLEEARRHGRFAVRRQPHSICADELLHPPEIVMQPLLVENRRRQAQVFAQQVPAKLSNLARF